jgi:predicted permease
MKTIALIILLICYLTVWGYIINKMVSTGRIKAKGAKKRRKKLLPFFYKKKKNKDLPKKNPNTIDEI